MKTITLWQPWAQLIACGIKTIETRTHERFKNLQGQTILIHAGQKWDDDFFKLAGDFITENQVQDIWKLEYLFKHKSPLVYSCLLAAAFVETTGWLISAHSTKALIDCEEGRFGLFLKDIKKIKPISVKGHQGIWNYEGEIIYL